MPHIGTQKIIILEKMHEIDEGPPFFKLAQAGPLFDLRWLCSGPEFVAAVDRWSLFRGIFMLLKIKLKLQAIGRCSQMIMWLLFRGSQVNFIFKR